jgi:hypothetical protein
VTWLRFWRKEGVCEEIIKKFLSRHSGGLQQDAGSGEARRPGKEKVKVSVSLPDVSLLFLGEGLCSRQEEIVFVEPWV